MIKKEIRRATQRKDWEEVLRLEEVLKKKTERRKMEMEIQKIKHDMNLSYKQLYVMIFTGWVAFLTFVATAFFKK